jgi:hypothetical protein
MRMNAIKVRIFSSDEFFTRSALSVNRFHHRFVKFNEDIALGGSEPGRANSGQGAPCVPVALGEIAPKKAVVSIFRQSDSVRADKGF